ncbi:hypothetical protein [Phyllobacterium leguminum]|uniref:Uncharacterized protein n=1 Tax=Phyllobacterium leguminum TaxID=314237 RepID=A0A318T2C7_9HYPH|nr:hypothetical protein [Phyllobacterium leguminum]PYE88779.1 hypothetical protein C7477_106152 [Phyllobacterium leguminum]
MTDGSTSEASSWRDHASLRRWDRIDWLHLTDGERAELRHTLEGVVRKVVKGHGIEVFETHVDPNEAENWGEYSAAHLLKQLKATARTSLGDEFGEIDAAAAFASEALASGLGGKFDGLHDTFIYVEPDGTIRPIRRDRGAALKAKREGLWFANFDNIQEARFQINKWLALYPWRNADSIHQFWRQGKFTPNSPIDHALHILNWHNVYKSNMASIDTEDERHGLEVHFIAKAAFMIGRHYEALLRKPYEDYAVKKLEEIEKNRANGKNGGQSNRQLKIERHKVLNRLALAHKEDFAFTTDKACIQKAKQLAAAYDKNKDADSRLFTVKGKHLSPEWYEEWLSQFRAVARKVQ